MNLLDAYKVAVIDAEKLRQQLESAEARVRDLEIKLGSPMPSSYAKESVPPRLQYLVDLFAKSGGRMSLNDVSKKVEITRTGVWNQIRKLIDLGHIRQIDRGLYELIVD